jgi:hypothetical protein
MAVDLDRFLRSVVRVRNEGGGRGYDSGIRTFDCPLCGDRSGRGWVGVQGWGVGCFNAGCDAEPNLSGGVVEWARRVLKIDTRAKAWRHLEKNFGGATVAPLPPTPRGDDFCHLPEGARPFEVDGLRVVQDVFATFIKRQWGLSLSDARRWDLRWCLSLGRHAFRVVIPVVMGGTLVGFQSRTIKDGVKPKYLTSSNVAGRHTLEPECGRPAAAMLFNVDAIKSNREMILVEGPGDAMGWHATHASPPAVALLGVALTAEKIAIIRAGRPSRVVVALDAEPEAQARAAAHVDDLHAHDVDACLGAWVGGKDAGSGAELVLNDRVGSLASQVRTRLGR